MVSMSFPKAALEMSFPKAALDQSRGPWDGLLGPNPKGAAAAYESLWNKVLRSPLTALVCGAT
jgi:hypothetical protein